MQMNSPRRAGYLCLVAATAAAWAWLGWRCRLGTVHRETQRWAESYGGWTRWSFESRRPGIPDRSPRTPEFLVRLTGQPILDDVSGIFLSGSLGISPGEFERLHRLPGLRSLDLQVTTLDDAHLEVLAGLVGLEALSLGGGGSISDDGLRRIATLRNLRSLELGGSRFGGEGLDFLGNLPRLESLSLHDGGITDVHLVHLRGLARLKWLDLSSTGIKGDGLVHLGGLEKLESLDLSDTAVGDEALVSPGLPGWLSELALGGEISDGAVPGILRLRGLRTLRFRNSDLTDAGIDRLVEGLLELESLFLDGTLVSGGKIAELERAGFSVEATY